ncbi:GRAM domain-containing protein [Umbelopsis sp. PMI_123]|nr:GRAM domain-containing protein [Umbelopsis sp. PMI_123]
MDSPRPRGISISTISSTTSLGSSGTDLNKALSLPSHGKIATRRRAKSRRTSLDTTTSSEGGFSAAGGSVATACGLEVANAKRNAEFHTLFRSVPEDDMLIEDYGCALQKEILVQGRIYISERHICFNANIFGWVTNLVLAFSEIVLIEKKMTAMIIPNGIQICTLHAKHAFASFLSRDMAYDQMMDVWRVAHSISPSAQKTSLLAEDGTAHNESSSDEETDDSDATLSDGDDDIDRTQSEASLTECQCQHSGSHYTNVALDAVFPGSIETLYNLLFNSSFISNFLVEGEKSQDVNIGNWSKHTDDKETVRKSTYIKYLGMSIGPKTTKCHLEERCYECDFNNAVSVLTTTQTPDIPMGTSFSVKTRACITSTGNGSVRLLVTFQVEFTKGGFLKSTIEKASSDGQITYYKNLEAAVRAYITSHPGEFGLGRKKKRDKRTGKVRKVKSEKAGDQPLEDMKKSLVPSSAQVTFFFFGLLVLSNVFLLKKMSYVDKQLSDLTTSHISSVRGISTATLAQEREHLWQQLRHRAQYKTKAQDDVAKLWNKRTMEILRQKAMLDQQILGMQAVIRGAEDQLDTLRPATSKKQN